MSNEKSTAQAEPGFRLEISGGFLLLLSLTGFFCGGAAIAAALFAAAFHELGHLALILVQGGLPRRLTLDMSGASLHCSGPEPDFSQELLRAAAGPFAGLLLWLSLQGCENAFLRTAADMSLMLSLANLLPARGLDGGRIMDCLTAPLNGEQALFLSAVLDGLSVVLALTLGILHSPQLMLYGLWLLLRLIRRFLRTPVGRAISPRLISGWISCMMNNHNPKEGNTDVSFSGSDPAKGSETCQIYRR